MRIWSLKIGGLSGKNAVKAKNAFFSHFVQIMDDKEYESGVLGEEVGETGKENAFFVQLEYFIHLIDNQRIMQIRLWFLQKSFAFRLHLQNAFRCFINLIIR